MVAPKLGKSGVNTTDSADDTVISGWGAYDVRGDVNLDGVVDGGDTATSQSLGRGIFTSSGARNRRGFSGYEIGDALRSKYFVRHRVFDSGIGKWMNWEPFGYRDGLNLTQYVRSMAMTAVDPDGLFTMVPGGASGGGGAQSPVGSGSGTGGSTGSSSALCEGLWNTPEVQDQKRISDAKGTFIFGVTACYDGKPLRCVYPSQILRAAPHLSPEILAAIVACTEQHEDIHVGHIKCPNKSGYSFAPGSPSDPEGRLEERQATGTDINCANQWIKTNGANPDMVKFRDLKCEAYRKLYAAGDIQGPKHKGCP